MADKALTREDLLYLLLLTILGFFVLRVTLYENTVWSTHDLKMNLARFAATAYALEDGQFPPHWSRELNKGYGYPLLLFYPPLTPLFVATLHLVGLPLLSGVKLLAFLGVLLSNYYTYRLGRLLWHREGGLLAAGFYLFLPYHVITLIMRGAMAEFVALGLLPALLLAFLRLDGKSWKPVIGAGLLSALLLLTHNASWLFTLPWLFVLLAVRSYLTKQWRLIAHAVIAVVISLGVSAFYWAPAFWEKKYVEIENLITVEHLSFRNRFVTFDQLVAPQWPYSGLGYALTIAFLLSLTVSSKAAGDRVNRATLFTLRLMVPGIILLSAKPARFLWEFLHPLQYVQFPWRLSGLAGLAAALCVPALFGPIVEHKKNAVLTFVVLAFAVHNGLAFCDREFTAYDQKRELSRTGLIQSGTVTVVAHEYQPKTTRAEAIDALPPRTQSIVLTGMGTVVPQEDRSHRVSAQIIADTEVTATFQCLWFPGWQASIDGTQCEISRALETGFMTVAVPSGVHTLNFRFTLTSIRTGSLLISALSVPVLFLLWVGTRRKSELAA